MPQITPYEDEQESVDQSTYDHTMGGHMIPFDRAWAVTGCITWRHNDLPLLTVPFLYTPTPFLPGAMTICDPSLLRPAHPMTDLSPTRQAPPLRTKLGKLPELPPGDEWVMVDHYWRHQLLGWTDGGPNGHPVGVSATTIEVGNLLPDDEDMDNMDLLLYVYRHFRPAGLIVSDRIGIAVADLIARFVGTGGTRMSGSDGCCRNLCSQRRGRSSFRTGELSIVIKLNDIARQGVFLRRRCTNNIGKASFDSSFLGEYSY